MRPTYNPVVHKLAVFVVCWTVLLFVAGALVTSNDAALSVPDWPKSHGSWFPPLETLRGGALFEFSHRVIAGSLGALMLVLAILLWKKEERAALRWFGVIAVAGVVVQAVLGGQVVLRLLHYWLPVIHACFAQIVFAAVLGIAMLTSQWWVTERTQLEDRGTPSIHVLAGLNAVVIYLQVILGAGFRLVGQRLRGLVDPDELGAVGQLSQVVPNLRLRGQRGHLPLKVAPEVAGEVGDVAGRPVHHLERRDVGGPEQLPQGRDHRQQEPDEGHPEECEDGQHLRRPRRAA